MKYAVAASLFRDGNLITENIYIIKADNPTLLKDSLFKILAMKNGIDYRRLTSGKLGLIWDHNNSTNTIAKGAFKIFQYLNNGEYWVCFYRALRESDTFTIKEENENEQSNEGTA